MTGSPRATRATRDAWLAVLVVLCGGFVFVRWDSAEGLSAASVAQVRPLLHAHWQRLTEEMVPLLERLIEQDAARTDPDNPNTHRVRFGLYGFDTTPASTPPQEAPKASPPRRARKTSGKTNS